MNVALSRAKARLFVIASRENLLNPVIRQIANIIEGDGEGNGEGNGGKVPDRSSNSRLLNWTSGGSRSTAARNWWNSVPVWKREGKTVVFTNGCYDLLHPGHVRLLEQARGLGDVLILALNSDASVRRMKGPSRPMISENERAEMALALAAVDAVTLFDEDTPRELIAARSAGRPGQRRRLVALHRRARGSGGGRRARAHGLPGTRIFYYEYCRKNDHPALIHPVVRDLFLDLGRHPGFQDVLHRVSAGENASLSGLTTTAKAVYAVLLWQSAGRPLIIVVDGNKQAEDLSEAINTFFNLLVADDRYGPQLLPALDVLPMQNLSPHAEICEQRAIGLWSLATRRTPITIMPVASALLRIEPADYYRQLALRLRVGEELPLDEVVAHLESIGYERREPVEMVGEYSVRGGILDVFSPEAQKPVRIDLFGDQVESIRRFDVESQRSVLKVEDCLLLPLTEYQKSRPFLSELHDLMREADIPGRDLPPPGETFPGWELVAPMLRPRNASVFSLLERPVVIWDEPEQVQSAVKRLWTRLEQIERSPAYDPDRIFFRWEDLERQALGGPQVIFQQFDIGWSPSGGETSTHIATRPAMSFHGNIQVAIAEARTLVEAGNKVAFFASATGEVERLADILNEYGIAYQLGLEQFESTPAYLAQRAYMSGTSANIYLVKGAGPPRHRLSRFEACTIRVGGPVRDLRTGLPRPVLEDRPRDLFRRHHRPEARRLRGPLRTRRGAVPGAARDLQRREQGRLHGAGVLGGGQALRAAHPHGPGAALPRRR